MDGQMTDPAVARAAAGLLDRMAALGLSPRRLWTLQERFSGTGFPGRMPLPQWPSNQRFPTRCWGAWWSGYPEPVQTLQGSHEENTEKLFSRLTIAGFPPLRRFATEQRARACTRQVQALLAARGAVPALIYKETGWAVFNDWRCSMPSLVQRLLREALERLAGEERR